MIHWVFALNFLEIFATFYYQNFAISVVLTKYNPEFDQIEAPT